MLNITKNLDDKKLTVYLEGRLDTTTAPQLEESMKESINDVSELIMDFEKLEYNTPPSVQPGMWWCDGCITPKHICIHCVRNYPSLSDCYCACKRRERRSDDQDS